MNIDIRARIEEVRLLIDQHLNGECSCLPVLHDYVNVRLYGYITFVNSPSTANHDKAIQLPRQDVERLVESYRLTETRDIDPSSPEHLTFYISKPTLRDLKKFRPDSIFVRHLKVV